MKDVIFIALFIAITGIGSMAAQTSLEVENARHLYGSVALNLGWTDLNTYPATNFYTTNIYLHRGKSANVSFSLGSNNFGFNLDFFSDQYNIDFARTINQRAGITSFEISGSGFNRLLMEGFLIGPYIGESFGYKKKFHLALMPAIGVASCSLPGLHFQYEGGGFSVTGPDVANRMTYALGAQFRYTFWKQFSFGVVLRGASFKVATLDPIKSVKYGISLSYKFPL